MLQVGIRASLRVDVAQRGRCFLRWGGCYTRPTSVVEENEAFLIRGWIPSLVRGLLGGTVGRVSTGVPVPGENRAGDVRWSPPVVPKRTISDSGVPGGVTMIKPNRSSYYMNRFGNKL